MQEPRKTHRVLILGGRFAGVDTARHLERLTKRRDDVEVWLVSRENFTLFSPLLPGGQLRAPRGATHRDRATCANSLSSRVITAEVMKIDLDRREATVVNGEGRAHHIAYDTLVLARSVPRPTPSASRVSPSTRSA